MANTKGTVQGLNWEDPEGAVCKLMCSLSHQTSDWGRASTVPSKASRATAGSLWILDTELLSMRLTHPGPSQPFSIQLPADL